MRGKEDCVKDVQYLGTYYYIFGFLHYQNSKEPREVKWQTHPVLVGQQSTVSVTVQ